MTDKQLISRMRNDVFDDCRDFWSVLESVTIKTTPQNKTKNSPNKNHLKVAVACACIVVCAMIASFVLVPNTPNDNNGIAIPPMQSQPIITAEYLDNDMNFIDTESSNHDIGRISKHLKEKMETAPSNALFRTVVSDPRYLLFLQTYEEDGISYKKLTEGYGKENGYEWHSQKIAQMKENSRMAYAEVLAKELGMSNYELPVHTSEFSKEEYNLIANLTREQIYALKDVGCHLKLGFAKRDANVMPLVTDSLYEAVKNGENQELNVLVVMSLDTMEYQQFNGEFFESVQLTEENLNTEYISRYMQDMIDEYSLTTEKTTAYIYNDHYDGSHSVCLNFVAELSNSQIKQISDDSRIRAISLYEVKDIDFEIEFKDDI